MSEPAETFAVFWRHTPFTRWQVQPFVYGEAEADAVGEKLMAQFGGEAIVAAVTLPPQEVKSLRSWGR